MNDDEKTPPIKLTLKFETSKYQNEKYKPELILHPSERTSNADLLIEVFKDNELQAVIPCEKSHITSNVPAIAGKYRKGSNFRDEDNDGISVYKLNFDLDPQLVCDFIEVINSGNLFFNVGNAIGFCILADSLNCAEFFEHGKKWVRENMKSEMIVDAWNYGDWFHESCLEFITNSTEFEFDQLYNQIGKLNLTKFSEFTEFINESRKIESSALIHLKLEWISTQSSVDMYVDSLLLKTDLSLIAEKHKLRYFLKIYDKLGSEALKNECREHMFKEIDMAIEKSKVGRTHFARYDYFRYSDEVSKEMFQDCTSYKYEGSQYLVLLTDEIEKDNPVTSWKIQVLDLGIIDNDFRWNTLIMISVGIHDIHHCEEAETAYTWNMTDLRLNGIDDESVKFSSSSYGSKLKANDIVEVKFDQQKQQVEFLVNEISQGLAFSNLPESNYAFKVRLIEGVEVQIVE